MVLPVVSQASDARASSMQPAVKLRHTCRAANPGTVAKFRFGQDSAVQHMLAQQQSAANTTKMSRFGTLTRPHSSQTSSAETPTEFLAGWRQRGPDWDDDRRVLSEESGMEWTRGLVATERIQPGTVRALGQAKEIQARAYMRKNSLEH